MTRTQGWLIVALLAFLCVHLLAADVVGVYLISKVDSSSSTPQAPADGTPRCDPEGDVCP